MANGPRPRRSIPARHGLKSPTGIVDAKTLESVWFSAVECMSTLALMSSSVRATRIRRVQAATLSFFRVTHLQARNAVCCNASRSLFPDMRSGPWISCSGPQTLIRPQHTHFGTIIEALRYTLRLHLTRLQRRVQPRPGPPDSEPLLRRVDSKKERIRA